jgi:fatty acid desaturase
MAIADVAEKVESLTTAQANESLLLAQQREIIPRKRLKPFTKRTDIHGILHLGGHAALIGGSGWLIYLATGTAWLIPAMVLHGILLGHVFAPMHECSHGTAFRTRWLNETVLWVTGIIVLWTPIYFRYDHAGHHTYAQDAGRDPQFALPKGSSWADYIYYATGIHQWVKNIGWILRHASGRMAPFNRRFVPDEELPRIFLEARVMLAVYAAVAVGAIVLQTWAPLIYWLIPTFIGLPIARMVRVADHVGCTEKIDLRSYARTVKTDPLTRFLCWNMPYHCEHHLAPSVPFHRLAAFHAEIGHEMNPVDKGFIAVQWEVLRDHCVHNFRLHLGMNAGGV